MVRLTNCSQFQDIVLVPIPKVVERCIAHIYHVRRLRMFHRRSHRIGYLHDLLGWQWAYLSLLKRMGHLISDDAAGVRLEDELDLARRLTGCVARGTTCSW